LGVQLDVGSRISDRKRRRWDGLTSGALPNDERASLLRELREHYGSRWARECATASNAPAKTVARHGFTISAGRNGRDDVHAVGVALKLNDGTGPYAF